MKYTKTVTLKDSRQCLIRNAESGDARDVMDVFLLTHDQTDFLASYGDEGSFDVDFERRFLSAKEASDKEVYLCSLIDGQIVGTASIDAIGRSKVGHRCELGVAIDRDFCGIGIGRALVTACIDCAKSAGYFQVELEVVSDNTGAILLYESLGFTEFGRNPRGFRSRVRGWQELVSMRLELD